MASRNSGHLERDAPPGGGTMHSEAAEFWQMLVAVIPAFFVFAIPAFSR